MSDTLPPTKTEHPPRRRPSVALGEAPRAEPSHWVFSGCCFRWLSMVSLRDGPYLQRYTPVNLPLKSYHEGVCGPKGSALSQDVFGSTGSISLCKAEVQCCFGVWPGVCGRNVEEHVWSSLPFRPRSENKGAPLFAENLLGSSNVGSKTGRDTRQLGSGF